MRHNIDANGVDVALGTFNFALPVVSIGPNDHHGLQYLRTLSGDGWTDNHTGGIYQDGSAFYVSFGDTSEAFTISGSSFISQTGDGSTLVRNGTQFTYTDSRGVEALFFADIDDNGNFIPGTGRLGRIRHPDGTSRSHNYRDAQLCSGDPEQCTTVRRAQSITNNFSYMLKYTYARNDLPDPSALEEWQRVTAVTAINIAIEYCDSFADSCALTLPWPSAAIANGGSPLTLPNGGIWQFSGSAVRRPGATSDDISYTFDTNGRISGVTNATGAWTYAYVDAGSVRTTTVQGQLGAEFIYTSNPSQEIVTSVEDALGRTTAYQQTSTLVVRGKRLR